MIASLLSRLRRTAPRGDAATAFVLSRPLRRTRGAAAACAVAALFCGAGRAEAQALSLYRQHEGPYEYVVTGNSFRTESNTGDACAVGNTADAALTLPAGATVVAAYLYWGGSGPVDNQVTFRRPGTDPNVTADGTHTDAYNNNGTLLSYFGGFEDVTQYVTAGGTYGVGNLDVDVDAPFCGVQGVAKGWALFVIYQQTGLPIKRIQLRHGLLAFRQATEQVTLNGFLGSNTPSAKVTFLLYEGDPDLAGTGTFPEQLLFNGAPFTDGLNPSTNPYNSTINTPSPGRANVYGVDLDTYDASSFFTARARTADVQLTAGNDMVVLQVILTSLSVSLVDVTPDGLAAPEQRLPGKYSRQFAVENPSLNSDSYDLIDRFSGTPTYLTPDSITGTGVTRGARADSARVTIAAGATRNVNVWYTVPQGASLQNLVHLRARSVTYPTVATAADTGYTQVLRVAPRLTITKSVSPQNTLAPGTELTYTMNIANAGEFAARGVTVTDSVPTQVMFKLGSVTQTLPAGITATVAYSSNGGTVWTYVPVSGGCPLKGGVAGYDACVTHVRWTLTGDLAVGAAASASSFGFKARIK